LEEDLDTAPGRRFPRLRTLVLVALGLLIVFLLGAIWSNAGGSLFSLDLLPGSEIENVGEIQLHSIRQLAELTTVEAVAYTTIEKGTDRGWLDWAAGDRISLFAVARIGAGVDLGELTEDDLDVDTEARSVRLTLPAATVTYVALDNEATHVYDRDTGIFTRGSPELEATARRAAEEIMVDDVIENGLLEDATETARTVLTDFMSALGYEDITVRFDD
jgi:hypothetical protein